MNFLRRKQQKQARNIFLISFNSQISASKPCSCRRTGYYHLPHCNRSSFQWECEHCISPNGWFMTKDKSQNWEPEDCICILAVSSWATHLHSVSLYFFICAMGIAVRAWWSTEQGCQQKETRQEEGLGKLSGSFLLHGFLLECGAQGKALWRSLIFNMWFCLFVCFIWMIKSGSNSNRFFQAHLKHLLCCMSGGCAELGNVLSDGDIIKCQHVSLNKVSSMGRSRQERRQPWPLAALF